MIHVCDAIMGSGKSQSAIAYMNEHADQRFVYITPYLDEADRIKDSCPDLNFKLPNNSLPEFQFSKINHTRDLMSAGENIATTHSSFRMYTQDMLESISQFEYTLIVDEAVEGFTESDYSTGDIQMLADAGYIAKKGDHWEYTGKPYTGRRLSELFKMLLSNNIIEVSQSQDGSGLYFWALPSTILGAFKEVFILTYLFNAQDLRYYLDINGMAYDFIGIKRVGDNYCFSKTFDYIPEYVSRLGDMIHVFDNQKLNEIGKNKHALSDNWYKRNSTDKVKALKNNLYNYLHNHMKASSDRIMWATFKNKIVKLSGRGFKNQHVVITAKATNEYRHRDILAYTVNIFVQPNKALYFEKHGIRYDNDTYALSVMLQWIWRSAIRDGKEIWIYIPSSRMRRLLRDWITKTQEEYEDKKRAER